MTRSTALGVVLAVVVGCSVFLPAMASAGPNGSWRGVHLSFDTLQGGPTTFEGTEKEGSRAFEGPLTFYPPGAAPHVFMIKGKFEVPRFGIAYTRFKGSNLSTEIRGECVRQVLDLAVGPSGASLWRCDYKLQGSVDDQGKFVLTRDIGAPGEEDVSDHWMGNFRDELTARTMLLAMELTPPSAGAVIPGETSFDVRGTAGIPGAADSYEISGVGELWGGRRFIMVALAVPPDPIRGGILIATGEFSDSMPGLPGAAEAVVLLTEADGSIKLGGFDLERVMP